MFSVYILAYIRFIIDNGLDVFLGSKIFGDM